MKTTLSKANYTTAENVVINWTAATNATKYGLSVWKAPFGNDKYLVFDQYVTGTSKNIGKLPAGSYRVHMMPYNAAGAGPAGNIIDFKVSNPPTATSPTVQPVTPGKMTTSLEKSGFTTKEHIVIKWTTATNATKYGLSVWKAPYGNDKYLVFDNYVTGNVKDIGTLPAGNYRIKMMPYNTAGSGPVGNTVDFVVKAPTTAAPASAPAAKSSQTTVRPGTMKVALSKTTFSTTDTVPIYWSASKNATKYGLTVRNVSTGKIVWDDYVSGGTKNIGKLPAGSYSIKMRPYNGTVAGPVSSAVKFKVKNITPSASATATKKTTGTYPWNASNCPMGGYVNGVWLDYASTFGADGNGGDGHGYGCRQCTSYVAWKIGQKTGIYPSWGNAKDFATKAMAAGYKEVQTPVTGSIAVSTKSTTYNPYGHVAWVESNPYPSNGKSVIRVSEYNNKSCGYGNYCEREALISEFDKYVFIKK